MAVQWERMSFLVLVILMSACGRSPTAPTAPPVAPAPSWPATVSLALNDTGTVPGTDITIRLESVLLPNLMTFDCFLTDTLIGPCDPGAGVSFQLRSSTVGNLTGYLSNRDAFTTHPGPDTLDYGGYRIRLAGFDPAYDRRLVRRESEYRAVLEIRPR